MQIFINIAEIRDVIEHYFWGKMSGLSLELGSANGHWQGRSQTIPLEEFFHWKRILVEANPDAVSHEISLS